MAKKVFDDVSHYQNRLQKLGTHVQNAKQGPKLYKNQITVVTKTHFDFIIYNLRMWYCISAINSSKS
jgi:hypothetical protein